MVNKMLLIRELFVFTASLILFIFALINIKISPPPSKIEDIPNQYGKTFCIPIQQIQSISKDQYEQNTKSQIRNAYILMILTLIISIVLLLGSGVSLLNNLLGKSVHFASTIRRVELR